MMNTTKNPKSFTIELSLDLYSLMIAPKQAKKRNKILKIFGKVGLSWPACSIAIFGSFSLADTNLHRKYGKLSLKAILKNKN